jgi:hypothetical protein
MTDVIQQTILDHLPFKRKQTPSGWISFNAVCCSHNGQGQDTRGRGGVLPNADGNTSYHCFNCGFTANWKPGRRINFKLKKLLNWLGVDDDEIRRLSLFALSNVDAAAITVQEKVKELPKFEPRDPCPGRSIKDWLNDEHTNNEDYSSLENACRYLADRGLGNRLDLIHWTNEEGMRNRILVPFTWLDKPMGYSGRLFVPGASKLKYLSNYPSNMIWGYDQQLAGAKFCIVVEGLLDAVSINGLAICGNEISETQATVIESLNRDIIVVPDRDAAGKKMIDSALEYGWNVAFPEWEVGVKDVNDAVIKYGPLFTMRSILNSVEYSNLKIKLMMKKYIS